MAQGYGYNLYAGFGEEVTFGTGVAGTRWFEIISENIKCKARPRLPAKALGSLSAKRTIRGKTEGGGSFQAEMSWNGFERLFKHNFGASSVATIGANPYTHTFTLKAALDTGLTLLINRDAVGIGGSAMFQYLGAHIAKLKISQQENEPLIIEPTFILRDVANVAVQAPTYPTWDPIEYGYMTIARIDPDGGATDIKIISFSLEIDNKLEAKQYLTSHLSQGVHRVDRRSVMWEAEIEFENLTVYNAYKNQDEHDFRFKWMKDSGIDTVNTLQIDMPKSYLEEGEPEVSAAGPIRISLKGVAQMSAADNDELVIVLKNTTAGPI
jgi:hypothetical protein